MATINGTFNSLIAGTLSGTVATPGATGPAGPAGPAGPQGEPGVGVPAGGLTGQFLSKASNLDYATGWTSLGTMASQSAADYSTTAAANALYYPLSGNPSGFLTAAALTGYATESFVTSQGYITSAALAGYATESWVQSQGYLTTPFNGGEIYNPLVVKYGFGDTWGMTAGPSSISITEEPNFYGQSSVSLSINGIASSVAAFPDFPSFSLDGNNGLNISFSGNSTTVNNGTLTYNGEEPYARKDGATFTGKINFTPVSGVAGLNIGIGGTSAASTTAGDMWIAPGGVSLNFRDGNGAWRICAVTTSTNTFSSPQIVDTTATTAALRVTQKGTGNAIEVEDSTTPDATRFVIDQHGKVGIGVAPDATAALKVDGNGIMFGGASAVQAIYSEGAPSVPAGWNANAPDYVIFFQINGQQFRCPAWLDEPPPP